MKTKTVILVQSNLMLSLKRTIFKIGEDEILRRQYP